MQDAEPLQATNQAVSMAQLLSQKAGRRVLLTCVRRECVGCVVTIKSGANQASQPRGLTNDFCLSSQNRRGISSAIDYLVRGANWRIGVFPGPPLGAPQPSGNIASPPHANSLCQCLSIVSKIRLWLNKGDPRPTGANIRRSTCDAFSFWCLWD